jgi:hypothetical protein
MVLKLKGGETRKKKDDLDALDDIWDGPRVSGWAPANAAGGDPEAVEAGTAAGVVDSDSRLRANLQRWDKAPGCRSA